ncbi:Glutathione S-transferase omega-like 2 [Cyphellophora attinorum]|uniref:Glutathione S-transferase omega-like 2 n=1 Tax=Cyphellophora attinorum TaxID=1664694 RepID=A0A0N1P0T6_9EURO|nr:Glutathione S-transferase omega-like 2 [Phialophora attinorum]KPI39552.1 Glutathione S-transferase omega-like 2 [Phialophora attinorum]
MAPNYPRPDPSTVQQHLAGSAQSWHGQITPDGPFQPEVGRYHMYIGLFCPFAHRANIIRHLFNLQDAIPISVVRAYPKGDENGWPGWKFPADDAEYPNATVDHLFGSKYLHEVYFKADPEYKGRYSVPVIWDKKTGTIVNNESAEIMRWLQGAFQGVVDTKRQSMDLYPERLRDVIDEVSEWMQSNLNRGVYQAGFAETQEDYEKMVPPVFAALNRVEKMIAQNGGPYLLGKTLTELDVRAYVTIVRFDAVYVQHFKLQLGTVRHNYPQINNWLKKLYFHVPGFKETTDSSISRKTIRHYSINPKAITPMGPYPYVEEGWRENLDVVGGIEMEEVVDLERQLKGGFIHQI